MPDYWHVLALALMPAAGSFAGGMIAELVPATPRILSRALHAAAGIAIAVVAVEMMPAIIAGAPTWAIVIGLCAGGAFYVLLEWTIAEG